MITAEAPIRAPEVEHATLLTWYSDAIRGRFHKPRRVTRYDEYGNEFTLGPADEQTDVTAELLDTTPMELLSVKLLRERHALPAAYFRMVVEPNNTVDSFAVTLNPEAQIARLKAPDLDANAVFNAAKAVFSPA
ncbi:hypothetical protein HYW42_05435 [Candidatus Daviesbacteria bacterium]|nr:hypothetical protein [Candidatus Daviesbacteria bacterium]